MSGAIPMQRRLEMRVYRDVLESLLTAAERERDGGRLASAWALAFEALAGALRQRWLHASSKCETPAAEPVAVAEKLRAVGVLDKATLGLVRALGAPQGNPSGALVDCTISLARSVGLSFEAPETTPADPRQDGDLQAIIAAWPKLPDGVKRGLVMIAKGAGG